MDLFSFFIPAAYAVDLKDFRQPANMQRFDPAVIWGLVIIILLVAGIILLNRYYLSRSQKKKTKKASIRAFYQKAKEMDLGPHEQKQLLQLSRLSGVNAVELITENEQFENAADRLLEKPQAEQFLQQIPAMRDMMGYTFNNRRTKFVKTQLLLTGQKLRVFIPHPTKDLSFVSSIQNCTEAEFWIKPPTVKGKPANLKKIKYLEFRVFRQGDSEYRFRSRVLDQIDTPMSAIIMEHSYQIEKLLKRAHERYQIQFPIRLFFITHGSGKTSKSHHSFAVDGQVDDLSTGGMKIGVQKLKDQVYPGDMVSFRFDQARLKKDIQAKLVHITFDTQSGITNFHLEFANLTELNRLFIQRFIENKKGKKV